MKKSPCYGCGERDYAGGCARNCPKRDAALAEAAEYKKEKDRYEAPGRVLRDSCIGVMRQINR